MPMVNQRRANRHLQLVILCPAHQPSLSIKERVFKTEAHFHSHCFFGVDFRICFSHVFLLSLFSLEKATWREGFGIDLPPHKLELAKVAEAWQ